MPNPKRRHSKQRRDKRRTHDALTASQSIRCTNCGEQKVAHMACSTCGFYNGRQVVMVRTHEK